MPVDAGSSVCFQFVGNDDDFSRKTSKYLDAYGVLQRNDAGLENDTMVLGYRVATVPDPGTQALLPEGLAPTGAVACRYRRHS